MDIKHHKIKLIYRKTGYVCLYSHLDMGRFLERALRRTSLPYFVTQGFNPHPKISFYGGIKLGVTGEETAVFCFTEAVTVELFTEHMCKNFPPELEIVSVERIE